MGRAKKYATEAERKAAVNARARARRHAKKAGTYNPMVARAIKSHIGVAVKMVGKKRKPMSEETKERLRAARLANKMAIAMRVPLPEGRKKRKPISEETKAKLRASRLAKKMARAMTVPLPEGRKKRKPMSEETKARLRAGRLAKKMARAMTVPLPL